MCNSLTIKAIEGFRPAEKTYRRPDGENLYLRISPTGSKYWDMKYKRPADGKEDTLVLGKYPLMFLKAARELRAEAQERIAVDIARKQKKTSENRSRYRAAKRRKHRARCCTAMV